MKGVVERIRAACEKLHDLRLPPELRGRQNFVSSETDVMNVVEQRILQSQREGHFENLAGKGRPLETEGNPHADPEEDIAYRVLAKNGFALEWIELNKEIRFRVWLWRAELRSAWQRQTEKKRSDEFILLFPQLEEQLQDINRKVLRHNLSAPFGRQVFGYKMTKELQRLESCQEAQQSLDADTS